MKIRTIEHIGIAVRDLEKNLSRWTSLFGARSGPVEEVKERGVRLAQLDFSKGPAVELISPLGENSPLAKFLKERGEGIHHFCFEVDDVGAMMENLKKAGLEFTTEKPIKGGTGTLIAFVHPRSLNGVLLELREAKTGPRQ